MRNRAVSCFMCGVIAAVLLNALVPGAGHLVARRWLAAPLWFAATAGTYLAGMTALVYAASAMPGFERLWRFGEFRLLLFFLLPGVVVHTWCCVSLLPSAKHRRLAVACAAAAMAMLLLVAPPLDLGLRRTIDAAADPTVR